MTLEERFIRYTAFDTQSSDDSQTTPSTEKQLTFAHYLYDEMVSEGLADVMLDDKGYLYATLPPSDYLTEGVSTVVARMSRHALSDIMMVVIYSCQKE